MLSKHGQKPNAHAHRRSDEANPPFKPYMFPERHLKSSVDLRIWMTPVKHQASTSSCCAIAFATICEFLVTRSNNRPYTAHNIDMSYLFLYYNGQRLNQRTRHVHDIGVNQRSVALSLRQFGICEAEFWPHHLALLNRPPSPAAYWQARKYTACLLRLPRTIESIETCLYHQIPVPIDIIMDDSTEQVIRTNDSYLNINELDDRTISMRDLHTVLLVGYDRPRGYFIARNSWGAQWGSQGYFYLPYAFLSLRNRLNPNDQLWTVLQIIPRPAVLPHVRQLVPANPSAKKRSAVFGDLFTRTM